ncbi:MAG TPA: multiheme c-type cytochrome [Candidatus Acidoferrales bacterium]|nr:multiheme c-type cytochrome [Candidatus Acidoferrales bacterium]
MDRLTQTWRGRRVPASPFFGAAAVLGFVLAASAGGGRHAATPGAPAARSQELTYGQTPEEAERKSAGCKSCHTSEDAPTMHPNARIAIGCTDCHGGSADVSVAAGISATSQQYQDAKHKAHPEPRHRELRDRTGVPPDTYTLWLRESPEYVKFVNPGDLRVAEQTCGQVGCHASEVRAVSTSMMTHVGFLWGAALYNNGAFPLKDAHFGESYTADGEPRAMKTFPTPTAQETHDKGVLPELIPLERWEISQPGNVLRVFERGGEKKGETGNPNIDEDPGKPDVKLSSRGFGTMLRTDPVFLGLQKTRLVDPVLSLPGTNDHPGDFRASGCTACHVVYANDRDPAHSGFYAQYGNIGLTATNDPTIPKGERGHGIKHAFTRAIPSSQCMACHVHPGTNMVTPYYGYTWWDNELDAEHMYPAKQHNPTEAERFAEAKKNPEAAAVRGLWSDEQFLDQLGTPEFNAKLKDTKFADFHGHGWVFRAVFKHDRKGNWLDDNGNIISPDDPKKFEKAVHLADIHLEKGMHCVDCHFRQDNHGNGKLYGEPRAAVEVDCVDCHGSIDHKATLVTSGIDAPEGGTPLEAMRTAFGERQFEWREGRLYQRAMLEAGKEWEVVQVLDTITPGNPHYSEKSRWAKTLQKDGKTWGSVPDDKSKLAHENSRMTCFACHTAWTTSCFGCHLQMTANARKPMLHYEGLMTRNYTTYNFQVLRDDMWMMGIDGTVTHHRFAPARSSCAIIVSSQNADRDWLYYVQQTISAPGFSGEGYSTYVPHTVRAKETKQCSDCHLSNAGDNNAWMASMLLQGTNFVNFMGRYVFVATGDKGYEAVAVAEHDEPEAIIGSDLQRMAYPDNYQRHLAHKRELQTAVEHAGHVVDLQARGEYLYAAEGKHGFRIYDIANIDNKDFSEKMTTAPVSPIGQKFYLKSKDAVSVASPTTLGVDPLRVVPPQNEEQPIHLMYGFLFLADREDGLVVVGNPNLKAKSPGVGTLLDGDPNNNFLKRAYAFNPDGALAGARRVIIAGTYAYVLCNKGLAVVDLSNMLAPKLTAMVGAPDLVEPRAVTVQFRYAFVTDKEGLKVLDVTDLGHPRRVNGALVPFADARNVYVARTYAYVSAGAQGLAIVDVERPEAPKLDQVFTADGAMNDVNDVKVGMVAGSAFAFVADGKNGMRVLQIVSPEDDPLFSGFSPRPKPKLIANYKTHGPALAISKGIDRDRAVDESGNQLAVFGRRGARPLNHAESESLYMLDGKVFTVSDTPGTPVAKEGSGNGSGGEHTGEKVSWLDRVRRTLQEFAQQVLSILGTILAS